MNWTLPKRCRVVLVRTNDADYLEAGCERQQVMTAAQWRLAQASLWKQGYRVVSSARVPLRRLAQGWWWIVRQQWPHQHGAPHYNVVYL